MIQNLVISGIHFDLDEDLKKYVQKKIGNLDRYLSRHAKESTTVQVRLKESNAKGKRALICEITFNLPHDLIIVNESSINIYAAVDIAEEKLRNLLIKYKSENVHSKIHKAWLSKREERRS